MLQLLEVIIYIKVIFMMGATVHRHLCMPIANKMISFTIDSHAKVLVLLC